MKRLILGTINVYHPEPGWENVHVDGSSRPIFDSINNKMQPVDYVCDIREIGELFNEVFDEVVMSQVLEHVNRDDGMKTLRSVLKTLKPGGVLRIDVPDINGIFEEWAAADGDHEKQNELMFILYGDQTEMKDAELNIHRWGYTPHTLKQSLLDAGFKDVQSQIANFTTDVIALKPLISNTKS